LSDALLQAFGKTPLDADTFLSGDKFTKVSLTVDYLIVVRRNHRPVAFGAGNFITPFLFYFNSLMVLPKYQRVGLGFYISALLWKYAILESRRQGYLEPDIVCRTHNRNVASGFLGYLREGQISTERNLSLYSQMIFEKTAKFLKCEIEPTTGISRSVYPAGLPQGTKMENERILNAFSQLSERDACYVTGKLNEDYVNGVLASSVKQVMSEIFGGVQMALAW